MDRADSWVPSQNAETVDPVAEQRALYRAEREMFGRSAKPVAVGRYTVGRKLGSGGFGVAYEATDDELHRKIAIKFVREQAGGSMKRAIAEARAAAAVSHPNVVEVFDVGITAPGELPNRIVYIAMELLEGGSLRDWLCKRRPAAEILRRFIEAGRGLAAAHALGVCHGDFKPSNILLGVDGRPRVADFGLARSVADGATQTSLNSQASEPPRLAGTIHYLAPEVRELGRHTLGSDQFAFCVALRDALAGSRLWPRVRPVVERGTRPDPAQRFGSMHALLLALQRSPARRRALAAAGLMGGTVVLLAAVAGTRPQPAPGAAVALAQLPHAARVKPSRDSPAYKRALAKIEEATTAVGQGRLDEAVALAGAAQVEAEAMNAPALLARATAVEAAARLNNAELRAARELYERAHEVASTNGEMALAAKAADDAMWCHSVTGTADWDKWRRHAEAALPRIEEPVRASWLRVFHHQRLATVYEEQGDFERGWESAEVAASELEALRRLQPEQAADFDPELSYTRGQLLWRLGRLAEARRQLELSIALREARYGGDSRAVAVAANSLASVLHTLGAFPEALQQLDRALQIERQHIPASHLQFAHLYTTRGAILQRLGQLEPAEADMRTALKIADGSGEISVTFRVWVNLAVLLAQTERKREAASLLERAAAELDAAGSRFWLERCVALLHLAGLSIDRHDTERALDGLTEIAQELRTHGEDDVDGAPLRRARELATGGDAEALSAALRESHAALTAAMPPT